MGRISIHYFPEHKGQANTISPPLRVQNGLHLMESGVSDRGKIACGGPSWRVTGRCSLSPSCDISTGLACEGGRQGYGLHFLNHKVEALRAENTCPRSQNK